jgi:hypothetical protein
MCGFREKRVKKVRLTLCTFGTANFFTRKSSEVFGRRRNTKCQEQKVTVAKRQNRAGATPLFCGQAAQKFRGVAPALRHEFSCRPFCHGDKNSEKEKDYANR